MAEETIILDKSFILNSLKAILNKAHTNPTKKEIKDFSDRLNFACPICGDSEKIESKKRGNIYLNNLMFKCFNCGHYGSFIKLCENYNVPIDIEKRIELYNYIDTKTYYKQDDDYVITKLDKLINLDDFVNFYNTHPENQLTNIRPVTKGSAVYQYLLFERNINDFTNLYEGVYRFTDKWREPVIIILNKHNNKLLGIQLRNLKDDKRKRFYKIYDFSDVYNIMYPDNKLDEFESLSYNKLSHFFNILNVDFSKPVTLFEGFFDSMFFPNSIGVIGVNTDISFLLKDNSLKIRFFYDNDKDGYKASIEKLKNGYDVFLWRMLFRDILRNKKDKYSAQERLKNIKDLNKLAIETKKNPYELLKLEKYFSKDDFDMMFLYEDIQLLSLV
jgi:predicted RNA-binding Zn-ribbon protein involved in translation (DUF1610 family)